MKTNNFYNPYRTNNAMVLRFIIVMMLLCLASWVWSCDSFTESDLPVSELNESAVFEQKNTADAAMTDIYAKIRDNGILTGRSTGSSKVLGLYADELLWSGPDNNASKQFFQNSVQPNNEYVNEWWNSSYNAIYASNSIIEGVTASTKLDEAYKKQLLGEATFVRALVHFYLVQVYGDIPYIITTDYTENVKVSRQPQAEVYLKIIADLEAASEMLPENYISEGRVRPNSFTAKALLARVYLFAGKNAEASNSASAVLNHTELYMWEQDLSTVFLKDSPTAIWQFIPRTVTRNTDDGTTFIFNSGPPPAVSLTESFVNSFEPNDLRRNLWVRTITNGSATWYHPYKYKKSGTSNPQQEFTQVFRLAEQYLIRAEARAKQGELIGAKEDLNVIRNAAGLANTTAESQDEILAAVLQERRLELFTEYGHRFMDLRRAGQLDNTLQEVKTGWESTDRLLPVPLNEITLNPNIAPQNPGY